MSKFKERADRSVSYGSPVISRKHRRPVLRIIILAIAIIAAIVLGFFGIQTILAGEANSKADEFRLAITENRYDDALSSYNSAIGSLKFTALSRYKNITSELLKEKIAAFSDLCRQSDIGQAGQEIAGIKVFSDMVLPEVAQLLQQNTDLYVLKQQTYDEFTSYLDNMSSLDFAANEITKSRETGEKYFTSRDSFMRAGALEQSDPMEALELYSKVIPEETEDFAAAQVNASGIRGKLKPSIFSQVDDYCDKFMYDEAVSILERAAGIFPGDAEIADKLKKVQVDYQNSESNLVNYTGPVEHLFTHCMIVYPEIAMKSSGGRNALSVDCITPYEFKKVIEQLYKNNYILIDINIMITTDSEGRPSPVTSLRLPKGKKPVIWSFDDVTYDQRKMGQGMIDKLVLDKDGNIAGYTKFSDGREEITYEEFIPILDKFVEEHPDFSFRGAKGTLALTGFDGTLGYRVGRNSPNRASEIEAAKPIIARLKETGWTFASHGYGHIHSSKASYDLIVDDTTKWENEIASLVGPTKIYIWPYGEQIPQGDQRFNYLISKGFVVFSTVDNVNAIWWRTSDSLAIINGRRNIDGFGLKNQREKYLKAGLFDSNLVIDPFRSQMQ